MLLPYLCFQTSHQILRSDRSPVREPTARTGGAHWGTGVGVQRVAESEFSEVSLSTVSMVKGMLKKITTGQFYSQPTSWKFCLFSVLFVAVCKPKYDYDVGTVEHRPRVIFLCKAAAGKASQVFDHPGNGRLQTFRRLVHFFF